MDHQELPDNREKLFPKKGIKLVNFLFVLSMFFYRSGFMLVACMAWFVYLIIRIRRAEKDESKTAYYILLALAVIMILVNLFFLL